MKMIKTIYILPILLFIFIAGCEKYEDYTGDFEYSTVYFGTQKPVRTVVARNEEMSFRFGVSLGGKYQNEVDEYVEYNIDTSLLRTIANNRYVLLPDSLYTLSDNSGRITIPAGKIIGDITLTLTRSTFCNDPLALSGGYALPLKLDATATSVDSVLTGNDNVAPKDYTVIVVKYVSPYSGTYYHRGSQTVTTLDSTYIIEYDDKDLSQNKTVDFKTVSFDSVSFTTVTRSGDFVINSTQNFKLCIKDDNTCSLIRDESKTSTGDFASANGTWEWINEEEHLLKINLIYNFSDGTTSYEVDESYTLRRSPEGDLRFEYWE